MNKKRLLTLDDLCAYYSSHARSTHFSSKDEGNPVVVQVPGVLKFDNNDECKEGLLPVVLQSCHIGKNINNSMIDEDVMVSALPSFSNRPILGYIHEVDGEWQFYKHNMHEDENGDTIYDEIPIGIVPESCGAKLEYDDEKAKTYVVINGYIFEEYSKAAEILKREMECSVSVELSIREFSYNAKEHCLVIEDFYFSGVTILGKTPDGNDVAPGMLGSNIKLADFQAKNNSLFTDKYEKQMIAMQEKIDKLLSCFNKDNSKKGGNLMNHFEELLATYNVTVEDISFDYEGMSDEELDAKFLEVFSVSKESTSEEDVVMEDKSDIDNISYTRTYELSHDDIRCALYNLLVPYEESDNQYYWISKVYDDYFIYESYCGETIYKQSYKKDEENVSFEGERCELYKEYLTASEKAELESMRSNYEQILDKVNKYEALELEAKKIELLNSEEYISIQNNENFVELKNNHENIDFEELQNMCDKIILEAVKAGKYSFVNSENTNNNVTKKEFGNPVTLEKTKRSRYGNLFKK